MKMLFLNVQKAKTLVNFLKMFSSWVRLSLKWGEGFNCYSVA